MSGIPLIKVGLQRRENGAFEHCNRDVASLAEKASGLPRSVIMVDGKAIAPARRLSAYGAAARLFGKPFVVLLNRDAVPLYHRSAVNFFAFFRSGILVEVCFARRSLAPFPHIRGALSSVIRMWHSMIIPSSSDIAIAMTP